MPNFINSTLFARIAMGLFFFASPKTHAQCGGEHLASGLAQGIKIPGFTAYLEPNSHAAQVNGDGITEWGTNDVVVWGGQLSVGELDAVVAVKLPAGETAKLKLIISGQTNVVLVEGTGAAANIDFGKFPIAAAGYQRIVLAGISRSGKTFGNISDLTLTGAGATDAFFNLKPRRNAASVHLNYHVAKNAEIALFYNELTPKADPTATYYAACGFSRGYLGMQVNGATERRIIFSVWDSGSELKDRKNVAREDLVSLVAKGDGVDAGSFGHEGTGGHSHLKYMWKPGQTHRFLVTAKADGTATVYSGYYFFNDRQAWGLIASFRAPHDGKLLRGLYSFNEDFDGSNGNLRRLCEFGNQWVRSPDGKWTELTECHFTHDSTGGKDRRDYGAGVTKDGRFFLSNGGFVADAPMEPVLRRPSGTAPGNLELPK